MFSLWKEYKRYRAMRRAYPLMLAAVQTCRQAERERRRQLLDGAPAATYTDARIATIDAAMDAAREVARHA